MHPAPPPPPLVHWQGSQPPAPHIVTVADIAPLGTDQPPDCPAERFVLPLDGEVVPEALHMPPLRVPPLGQLGPEVATHSAPLKLPPEGQVGEPTQIPPDSV